MGLDAIIQFQAKEDNCIYFYNEERKTWMKICAIESPKELPLSVREQVRKEQERADHIANLPL